MIWKTWISNAVCMLPLFFYQTQQQQKNITRHYRAAQSQLVMCSRHIEQKSHKKMIFSCILVGCFPWDLKYSAARWWAPRQRWQAHSCTPRLSRCWLSSELSARRKNVTKPQQIMSSSTSKSTILGRRRRRRRRSSTTQSLQLNPNLYHVKKLYKSQCIALLKKRKVDR